MKKMAKILLIGIGFGLVAVVLGFLTSKPAPAQIPAPVVPVKVTNTPLPVQGSVNANVTNTVPVSGTVAVSSLPALTLTGNMANSANNPLFVRDVDNTADEPFNAWLCLSVGSLHPCNNGASNTMTVATTTPDGKTVKGLVIDYVSGWCQAYPGADVPVVVLAIPTKQEVGYFVPITTSPPNSSVITSIVAQETRLYLTPGETIEMGYSYYVQAATVSNSCQVPLAGHYVVQ